MYIEYNFTVTSHPTESNLKILYNEPALQTEVIPNMDFFKDKDITVSRKRALLQVRDPWVLGANSNVVLTVQREHGVKDLALHLSRTL